METIEPSVESRQVLSACNLCEAICGIELTIEDRPEGPKVTSIRGNDADPLSRGHICPKGVALADIHEDPDRLRRPVKRVGDEWVEISWDEALDLTADGLAAAINQHGKDAVGMYFGNPNVHSLGSQTHGVNMNRSFKSRNKFSASSVDQVPHQFVAWQLFGHQLMLPIADIDRTSYFLVFGANPMASNGSLMTVPDFPNRLRALKKRGGRMVVFDPRRTETAKVADEHHFVRPATDAAVLLAMVHVLFEEDLTDPPDYVEGIESVRLAVADYTPEYAEEASGVPADEIRRITREFAAADGAAAYGRVGLSTQGFGSICQWAIHCLNILSGNFDREGGVLFTEPAVDVVGKAILGRGHYDLWRSRVRGIPEFSGELPVSTMREEIETPGEGQIRAMLTVAGNPVLSTPDGGRLGEALAGLDFMAAVDIYLNETTRHADVVLPPTTTLERDQYDLVFHSFAVRNTARWSPPVFEKPEDAMHDWEIYREITLRTAARLENKKPMAKALKERAALSVSPATIVTTLLLTGRRTTMRALRSNPEGVDLGPLKPTMPARLQTKDKQIHLAPDLVMADLPRLRSAIATQLDGGQSNGSLLLIGRRHQRDNNSWMHQSERLTRGKPRHQLLMNPEDLDAHGLTDGSRVRVASRVGEVTTEVRATDDMMRGVVSLPHGFGHQGAGMRLSKSSKVVGVSVNDITDPELLDISGNAALNGVPVTVTQD